jgi:hypothetical protein
VTGRCRAPDPGWIEKSTEISGALLETNLILDDLWARHSRALGVEPSQYDVLRSGDVTMNPTRIMRDLVGSAMSRGVEFETGVRVEAFGTGHQRAGRLQSIRYRNDQGGYVHLRAAMFILTAGRGFDQLAKLLDVRREVRAHKSYAVVAYPALSPVNFVRMSPNERYHFNHLNVTGTGKAGLMEYSMLADSGYRRSGAETTEFVHQVDTLLESAQNYFGADALYARRLHAYECAKTEFIGETEEERRYSYWIECDATRRYASVLPGKFSFFPTVAWQTYQKVKDLLAPPRSAKGQPARFELKAGIREAADDLVADHYPYRFLSDQRE